MSKQSWSGRLPNGRYTTSADKYASAWRALAKKVERFFPGYKAASYDPGISFYKMGKNGLGVDCVIDELDLSVLAIETLLSGEAQ